MRLFLTIMLLSVLSVSAPAFAQSTDDDGRTVYGNSRSNNANPIFVPSGASNNYSGPISIKQLLQNKDGAASGSRTSYRSGSGGFTPYGTQTESYSLSMTPEDVRANRASREAHYKEQEARRKKAQAEAARAQELASQKSGYLNKFQKVSTTPRRVYTQAAPVYKSNRLGVKEPRKVFNSTY